MVTLEYPPVHHQGGMGTHTAEVVRGLVAAGHEVDVVLTRTPHRGRSRSHLLEGHLVHEVSAEWRTRWRWRQQCRSPSVATHERFVRAYGRDVRGYVARHIARARRPDLVHIQGFFQIFEAMALREALGTPIVMTLHQLCDPIFSKWCGVRLWPPLLWLEEIALREADAIITVSQALAGTTHRERGVPEARLHAVHNGIDLPAFVRAPDPAREAALRRRYDLGSGPVVVFVARLTRQKGALELMQAAAIVAERFPETRYLLVGDEHSSTEDPKDHVIDELRALVGTHAILKDRVIITGQVPRDDLHLYYRLGDLAVVPSNYESFGYAAVEAMALGLPVVASDSGGLAEIIEPGKTGLLVRVRQADTGLLSIEPNALAQALIELIADPARRAQLGQAARAAALMRFGAAQMSARTAAIYESILAAHRG